MKIPEMHDALRIKNNLLIQQSRRIILLEEKMTEWRKKYFQLKYASFKDGTNNVAEEALSVVS